jgi:CBS-domain-containing membrane protein
MKTRLVRDVMTKDVVSVRTYTPFRMVASAMLAHNVGALPVVDALDQPIGIVSRTDLLAKRARLGHGVLGSAWERLTVRGRRTTAASHGRTAVWMMSRHALTITPEDTVFRAAYLMRRHDVSHLPVVDGRGVLVGIVSRGDLLSEFTREDILIRDDVCSKVIAHRLEEPGAVEVAVDGGVVTLDGEVRLASDAVGVVEGTRALPGVVDVVDHLRWHTDDRAPQVAPLF